MSTVELRKKLIERISNTDDEKLLEEAFRLLEMNNDFDIYKLNQNQKEAIEEARGQVKRGKYLADDQANKDIDEWLKR